jgi:hypothetical protein
LAIPAHPVAGRGRKKQLNQKIRSPGPKEFYSSGFSYSFIKRFQPDNAGFHPMLLVEKESILFYATLFFSIPLRNENTHS